MAVLPDSVGPLLRNEPVIHYAVAATASPLQLAYEPFVRNGEHQHAAARSASKFFNASNMRAPDAYTITEGRAQH
jgi:hypothetical protein